MNARTLVLSAALATSLGSCIYVDDDPYYDPYVHEVEPNDFYWSANGLGSISVGEEFLVRGHITDFGSDRFDGFAFHTAQPMDIEFALWSDDPDADFDVALFDPQTLSTVATWETPFNPELGEFSVWSSHYEFHLVVSSFFGSGSYTLEVRGRPLASDGAALEGLAAQGSSDRVERAVDWNGYSQRNRNDELPASVPTLRITTIAIDPATGRVEQLQTRRIPVGALLDDPR